MKKQIALLLILALCLAGCGVQEPETTAAPMVTETVTEPVTEAPAETTVETTVETEPAMPQTMEVEIRLEGEPEMLTMELFDGGSYGIYIPRDDWTLETEMVDGRLTDCWTSNLSQDVTFRVVSHGNENPDAVEKRILVTQGAYHFDPEVNGTIGGRDNVRGRFMTFSVRTDGSNTFALVGEYPGEFGDGFAPRIRAMMDSFFIK